MEMQVTVPLNKREAKMLDRVCGSSLMPKAFRLRAWYALAEYLNAISGQPYGN